MEDRGYTKQERKDNLEYFNNEVLPELKKLYHHYLINEDTQQNRFRNGKNIVDYFPLRKRLCYVNLNQWFTLDENEFISSRITFLLNRK